MLFEHRWIVDVVWSPIRWGYNHIGVFR